MTEPATQSATEAPTHPKIYVLDETPADIKIKMCLYGRSGVGKTRMAGSLAKHFKTFVMSSEKSDSTYYSHPDIGIMRPNLKLFKINSWKDTVEAYEYIFENHSFFDWIVADSMNDINEYIIEDVRTTPDEALTMRDWGKVSARLKNFIRRMRDLDANILFISLAKGEKNEMTGEVTQHPALTGQIKEEMPAYMDICGYMYSYLANDKDETVHRAIQFVSTPKAIGKDRFDRLHWEKADMTEILKKIGVLTA